MLSIQYLITHKRQGDLDPYSSTTAIIKICKTATKVECLSPTSSVTRSDSRLTLAQELHILIAKRVIGGWLDESEFIFINYWNN